MDLLLADAVVAALGAGIRAAQPVHGGDFASAYRVDLDDGRRVFLKTHPDPPPEFFLTESLGLRWLRDGRAIAVPQVLGVGDAPAFLALEWIEVGGIGPSTDEAFGRELAALHQSGARIFGRDDHRRTGSQALPNDPCETWAEFYATRRLQPLADIAERNRALPEAAIANLRSVAGRLTELTGPIEAPARLHGDLWAGNRLVDVMGRNWLVDPAAFGGHREFDLAMMALFGGFGSEAVSAYGESFPLAEGWRERIALNQIAPLVVHAIKFAGSYVDSAVRSIARYC